MDPRETVGIEHADRVTRLRRVAARLGLTPPPVFTETVIPADRLPANFHVDTPVLRVSFAESSFFDTGKTAILSKGQEIVFAVAEALRGDSPDAAVFVAGHTDSRGSEPYNYNLSVNRAEAVSKALFANGVGEVALWRVGFGEAVPLYPNDSDEHMAFNRRVEFLFSARAEPILDILRTQLDTVCIAANSNESAACLKSIEVRSKFEAVQVTSRQVSVGLQDGGRKTIAPAPRRVSIDLQSRRYSIDVPTR